MAIDWSYIETLGDLIQENARKAVGDDPVLRPDEEYLSVLPTLQAQAQDAVDTLTREANHLDGANSPNEAAALRTSASWLTEALDRLTTQKIAPKYAALELYSTLRDTGCGAEFVAGRGRSGTGNYRVVFSVMEIKDGPEENIGLPGHTSMTREFNPWNSRSFTETEAREIVAKFKSRGVHAHLFLVRWFD